MLYIHVGMGKTGTTSIQYFSKNSELSSKFFHYLTSGLKGDGHHLLALNDSKKQKWIELMDEIALIKSIDDNSLRPYFISTENLFFESTDFLNEIQKMLDSKKIAHEIIISYRSFSGYALSTYLEYISQGRLPIYFHYEQFLDAHLQSIRYDKRIKNFVNTFKLSPIYYDFDEGRKNGHLESFFKTWLKSFPDKINNSGNILLNQSLTHKGAIIANVFTGFLDEMRRSSSDLLLEKEYFDALISYGMHKHGICLDEKLQLILRNKCIKIIDHVRKANTRIVF